MDAPDRGEKYAAIFFDVGGTLLRANPSIGAVYAEVAARYQIDVQAEAVERAARRWFHKMREEELAEGTQHTTSLERARRWWRRLVRLSFGAAADTPRFDDFFEAVFDEFARPERYRTFPEVPATLAGLRAAGYRLGIISNWDARLRPILEGLGLAEAFDPILISGEVGVEKPDRAIYELARQRLGARDGAPLLQVGDHPRDDVAAARAAGFEGRLVNRSAGQTLATTLADLLPPV